MLNHFKALTAGLLFILMLPVLVMAQDTTVAVGDLISPWLELVLAAAAIIIPAVATWAAAELRRRTGIAIEASHRNAFQTALLNGAGLLVAKLKNASADVKIDARHPAIRDAILYVNDAAPDAIAYWGLTPEAIAEKLVAKLGLLESQTPTNVTNNVTQSGPIPTSVFGEGQ